MSSNISQVYSDALFELALADETLDSKKDNLLYIKTVLDENEGLNKILQNPNVHKDEKKNLVDQVFPDLEKHTLNFVKILIDKSRFYFFDDIFSSFLKKYNDKNNIARGLLTSSREMSNEDKETIMNSLSKKLGKQVELDYAIDPNLIGGFSVKIDGKLIDNSIKSRLLDLGSSLKKRG